MALSQKLMRRVSHEIAHIPFTYVWSGICDRKLMHNRKEASS